MCKCLQETKKNTIDFIAKGMNEKGEKFESINDSKSGYENIAFTFHPYCSTILTLPFNFVYTPINKKGFTGKEKTKKVSISMSYCPFCGQKQN